ncbi:hypothetical protein [Dyadobacter sp. LHD-138]|uniref:hypothetical protein n=1 Tax=Dyadobacter sp. LHD-138 TaxID=3071413 RepID=UPI0027E1C70E|nr:hypothetical protein [Dyadobacter sp. LHD-138]MDQ6477519.1 hypothetical protein [Dyadobacter sp. LHD-138]
MKVTYYLDEKNEENLYCRISDGTNMESFPLGYAIVDEEWDEDSEEGSPDDPYFYTLIRFKEFLLERYEMLEDRGAANVLTVLKNEVEVLTTELGIQGIARKMFNDENHLAGVPSYDQFLRAFETYSKLENDEYEARVIDNTLEFITEDEDEFQMDTHAGLTARLKSFVDKKSHAEIATMTDKEIWGAIYVEAAMEKPVFISEMLREWEMFWDNEYEETLKSGGGTADVDKLKEKSWRQFQVFMACYNETGDNIQLAHQLDDIDLYAIAVLTMLGILDTEACFEGYCEAEFKHKDWEVIESGGERFFVKGMEW